MSNTVEVKIIGEESVTDEIAKVQAALNSLRDKTVNVNIDVDKAKLKKSLDEAVDGINRNPAKKRVQLEVHQKTLEKSIGDAVKNAVAKDGKAKVKVDVDDADAKRKFAEIKAASNALSTDDINIDVDVETAGAMAKLAALQAAIDALHGTSVDVEINISEREAARQSKRASRRAQREADRTPLQTRLEVIGNNIDRATRKISDDLDDAFGRDRIVNVKTKVDHDSLDGSINDFFKDKTYTVKAKVVVDDSSLKNIKDVVRKTPLGGDRDYDYGGSGLSSVIEDLDEIGRSAERAGDKIDRKLAPGSDNKARWADFMDSVKSLDRPMSNNLQKSIRNLDEDFANLAKRGHSFKFGSWGNEQIGELAGDLNRYADAIGNIDRRRAGQDLEERLRRIKNVVGQISDDAEDMTRSMELPESIRRRTIVPNNFSTEMSKSSADMIRSMRGTQNRLNSMYGDMSRDAHRFNRDLSSTFNDYFDQNLSGAIDNAAKRRRAIDRQAALDEAARRKRLKDQLRSAAGRINERDIVGRVRELMFRANLDVDDGELDRTIRDFNRRQGTIRLDVDYDRAALQHVQRELGDKDLFQRVKMRLGVDVDSDAVWNELDNIVKNPPKKRIGIIRKVDVDIDERGLENELVKRLSSKIKTGDLRDRVTRVIDVETIVNDDRDSVIRAMNNISFDGLRRGIARATDSGVSSFRRLRNAISDVDVDNGTMFDKMTRGSHRFNEGLSKATRRIPVVGAFFGLMSGIGTAFKWLDGVGKNMQEVGGAMGKLGTVVRAAGALGSLGTAAAGAATGLSILSAIGVAGTGAIAAGAVVAQAALAGIVGISSVVAGAIGAAVAAPFVYFAAQSEEVKSAYSELGDYVKSSMTDISAPVIPSLVNMANSLRSAFDQMAPSMQNVSNGTADLINQLGSKLPAIAKSLGPAMEKAFSTGAKHLNAITDAMPGVIDAFGNVMDRLGSGEAMKATKAFWQGLPKWIERAGGALEGSAEAFNNINEFMSGDQTKGFRDGMGSFFDEMGATDWSGLNSALGNAMNTFGSFMGSIDGAQLADIGTDLANGFASLTQAAEDGRLMTAIEGLSTAFEMLGAAGETAGKGIDWFANLINAGDIQGRKKEIEELGAALDSMSNHPFFQGNQNSALKNARQGVRDTLSDAVSLPKDILNKMGDSVLNIEASLDVVGVENATKMLDNTRFTIEAMLQIDSAGVRDSLANLNKQVTSMAVDIRPENLPKVLDAQSLTIRAALEIDSTASMSQIDGLMKTIALEPVVKSDVFDSMLSAYTATVNATLQVDDANLQQALSRNYTAAVEVLPKLGDSDQAMGLMNAIQISAEIIPKLGAIDPAQAASLAQTISVAIGEIGSGDFARIQQGLDAMIGAINAQIQLHPEWNIPPLPPITPGPTLTPTIEMPNNVSPMPSVSLPVVPNVEGEVEIPKANLPVDVVPETGNAFEGLLDKLGGGKPVQIPAEIIPPEGGLEGLLDPGDAIPLPVKPELLGTLGDLLGQIAGESAAGGFKLKLEWEVTPPPIPEIPDQAVGVNFNLGPMPNIPNTTSSHDIRVNVSPYTVPGDTSSQHSVSVDVAPYTPPGDTASRHFVDVQVEAWTPPGDTHSTHTVHVVTKGDGTAPGGGGRRAFGGLFGGFGGGSAAGLYGAAGASSSFRFSVESIKSSILRIAHDVEAGLRREYERLAKEATEALGTGLKNGMVKQAPKVHEGAQALTSSLKQDSDKIGKSGDIFETSIEMGEIKFGTQTFKATKKFKKDTDTAAKAVSDGGKNLSNATKSAGKEAEAAARESLKIGDTALKNLLVKSPSAWGADSETMDQIRKIGLHNRKVRELFNELKTGEGTGRPGEGRLPGEEGYKENLRKRIEALTKETNDILGDAEGEVDYSSLYAALEGQEEFNMSVSLSSGGGGGGPGGAMSRASQSVQQGAAEVRRTTKDAEDDINDGKDDIDSALKELGQIPPPKVDVAPDVQGLQQLAAIEGKIEGSLGALSFKADVGIGISIPSAIMPPTLPPMPQLPTLDVLTALQPIPQPILPVIPAIEIPFTPLTVPQIVIPTPAPVQIPVAPFSFPPIQVPTPPPINVDIQANASAASASLKKLSKNIAPALTPKANTAAAQAQISALKKNTSSTHTVRVRVVGDKTPGGGKSSFAGGLMAGLSGGLVGSAGATSFNYSSELYDSILTISDAVKSAVLSSWFSLGQSITERFNLGISSGWDSGWLGEFFSGIFGPGGVGGIGTQASISVYENGKLVSKQFAEGIRDGNKYIVKAGDEFGDAVFTMPKKAAGDMKSVAQQIGELFTLNSIGTDGISFSFDLEGLRQIFQKQAISMSAGYLNEHGQFIVYNVTDQRSYNNSFDGGLVGDPERQARTVLRVLNESGSGVTQLQQLLGNGTTGSMG